MAIGILIGGVFQVAIQIPSLVKAGYRFKPVFNLYDKGLKRIFTLMLPAIVGLSATQINIFINTYFAARCIEGSVSWLNYAFRLMQFPIGLFGVAISIATLPVVSRQVSNKDIDQLKTTFSSALVLALLLTIPASLGLSILSKPIIRLIFEHGKFVSYDTDMTSQALVFYSIGLFAYASVKVIVPVYYALGKTRYPVIGSIIAVITNLIVVSTTISYLQHKAIAFSTSLSMIINFGFLSVFLYKRIGNYNIGYIWKSFIKVITSTLLMGIIVNYISRVLWKVLGTGLISDGINVLLSILIGIVTYTVVLKILKLKELEFIIQRFKNYSN